MAYSDNFDSVFDQNADADLDFDVMFDEDDRLVDIVAGLKEDGTLETGDEFEGIHLSDDEPGKYPSTTDDLDDKATPNDVKDALGDRDTISGQKVENGSEQEIGDNDDNEKKDVKGDDLAWFEDEDDKYQDCDFSKGTVDPESINNALEDLKECDISASEDVAGKTSDDLDIEDEDDPEERKDDYASDDGVGEFKGDTDLDPKTEASAFLESEDSSDVTEENPMAPDSLDDYDLANDADETKSQSAGVDEAVEHGPKFKLALTEEDNVADDAEPEEGAPENADDDDSANEASSFLESDDEGMIEDDSEGEVHKEVQCDGTEGCRCPACQAKKLNVDFELAVGDLAEAVGVDVDVEEIVDDEDDLSDPDLGEIDSEEAAEDDFAYDPSDEDLIDYAINDEDDDF